MVLGLVVTAVGGMGVFAPFTDRATTGVNTVTSGERPRAADLKLAYPVGALSDCDTATYSDNTTTAAHTYTNAQPGTADEWRYFCLRNAGSAPVSVSLGAVDGSDVDHACTGDEAAAGDTTCGDNQLGELSGMLSVGYAIFPCTGGSATKQGAGTLVTLPFALGTLPAGATWCGVTMVGYPDGADPMAVLRAQSDTVTWKWVFDATT